MTTTEQLEAQLTETYAAMAHAAGTNRPSRYEDFKERARQLRLEIAEQTAGFDHWVLTSDGGTCLKAARVVSRFRTDSGSRRVTVETNDGETITTIPDYVTKRS